MEEFELRNKTLKKSFDILLKPSFEMSVPNLTFFYLDQQNLLDQTNLIWIKQTYVFVFCRFVDCGGYCRLHLEKIVWYWRLLFSPNLKAV